MARLKALKPEEVMRALERAGFYVHHKTGGHSQLRHREKHHLRVTVPSHSRFDLPLSVIHSILKQAGVSREKFKEFL